MARVTVRYWAAAKEAANTAEETVSADTLADALDAAREEHAGDSRFAAVLARSSFLVDGAPAGRRAAHAVVLAEESVIEVLPAFAGG
ncbi:MAG TPA: MoaD/ThiS family protein [Streptosporangiaceae bacterium]